MPATPPESPRLFLIDGYALIYRAFYALITRPLRTSRGENTSAAWGVINFLQRLIATHQPTYIGWVHDSGLSFRHERYPAYKATREKLSDELQADFDRGVERIEQLLVGYRIPLLAVDGYEADDVIGTLAQQGVAQGVNVVIVSGDKDFYQLIRPGIWLLNPGRGGPAGVEEQWVGPENASERLGVSPEHVTDYLALVGDSSDNVPGVKGIGDKSAIELINAYGSVESILAQTEHITKKRVREALQAQSAEALLSKELVTIQNNIDITLDLAAMKVRDSDTPKLRELFVELEFHGLAKALPASGEAANPAEQAPVAAAQQTHYTTVSTTAEALDVVSRARTAGRMAFDTETILEPGAPDIIDPLRAILVGLTIGVGPGDAYYFPFRHQTQPVTELGFDLGDAVPKKPAASANKGDSIAGRALAAGSHTVVNLPALTSPEMAPLRALLEDATIPKVAQNGKYDVLVLRRSGVHVAGLDFDTMIASYVLDPGRRSHGLDMLALQFLGHRMTSYDELCGKGKGAIPFDQVPIDCARDYSCEDADMTLQLQALFAPQMDELHLTPLFTTIEMPLVPVLADMEWTGITIDTKMFAVLKERFNGERMRVEEEIYTAAEERFNINSNPKLREILFEKLKLPVLKKTATGASTDASVLQQLSDAGHVLPALIMEYRELSKLESTYIDTLPALVNPHTGRLHTSFNQTVAATGRLSSQDPNLQNIPIRRELGRDIRRAFIPRAGWTMLAADYSQIELRLLAHLSQDVAFVEAFRSGGDIHRQTAALIFGTPLADVTSEMRGRAKTINFATIYGQGAHALSQQLHITHAEAKAFIEQYFERFTGVRHYLDSMVEFARTNGYVQTIFGRRRYIPELRDANFNIRAFGERTAANTPIQGSAADLIKIAMINVAKALQDEQLQSRMLLQVHDELVFEAPPEELARVTALVRHHMEHAATLSVPLVVDVGTGANWVETK